MPNCAFSSDSLALRVIAISSGSQPARVRQLPAHGLDAALQHVPHGVVRAHVAVVEIVACIASCTVRGDGQTSPLFRLIMVRSTVKALRISAQ